jgi:hypothetical protein
LSVLTEADEIQLDAVFFAWVCDSYMLFGCKRILVGCKHGRAGYR